MKKVFILIMALLVKVSAADAQTLKVDTLRYKGDINKYINIVILGDGYTALQQSTFKTDAINLSNYLLTQVPFSNYTNYFNVFAIEVISAESGAKHPGTASDCNSASPPVPVSNPNVYLGSTFDYAGIHRLVVPVNSTNIYNVLSANFPKYDQVLIVVNSPYYGGSGGSYATSTTQSASPEITAHEIGHSFSSLADEYWVGDGYAYEKVNMTKETNPAVVKWKNWIGYNSVGIYQHCCGGTSAQWYRPHNNCKMRYLGVPYCNVCAQAITESVHTLVNPIVSYIPSTSNVNSADRYISFKLTEVMRPVPNTLNIKWKLDGYIVSANTDSVRLDQYGMVNGIHTLTMTATDTTALLRVDNHSAIHFSTVTWTINKTNVGLKLRAADNKMAFSVYPNPASGILNISVDLDKRSDVSVNLVSSEGKVIQHITNQTIDEGVYLKTIQINDLPVGTYFVVFKVGDFIHSETVIRQ